MPEAVGILTYTYMEVYVTTGKWSDTQEASGRKTIYRTVLKTLPLVARACVDSISSSCF